MREGEEVIITALPLYHIFALTANCLVFMRARRLQPPDHQSARHARLRQGDLKNIRFTALTGVNTLFNGLLNTPGFDKVDFSRLHLTLGGGMAVQRAVAERWKKVTGCTLVEAYGLTETSPGGLHQSARHAGIQRLDRPADPVDRRLRSRTTTASRCRSAKSASCACAARR